MARWSVDAMAEQAGRFAVVTGVINFGATGVPDGLDPIGVEIALEGGSSWGASDQARYDAWAQQGQSTLLRTASGATDEWALAAVLQTTVD